MDRYDRVKGGLYGLLAGDALGVPYEFHAAAEIPPYDRIEMKPPAGFPAAGRQGKRDPDEGAAAGTLAQRDRPGAGVGCT